MTADQNMPFGVAVRRARIDRYMTLAELARETHYSKGYLSKIENGVSAPNAELAWRLDRFLQTDGALQALAEKQIRSIRTTLALQPPPELLAPTARTSWRRPAPGSVDPELTETAFRGIFAECRKLGHQGGAPAVVPMVTGQFQALHALALAAGEGPEARGLWVLLARFAEYAGWMVQEMGDEAGAVNWTDTAVRLAHHAGDHDLAQFAFVRHADLALYRGDAAATITLARRAQQDEHVSARVRGLAAQREAQGHALASDHTASMTALERARELSIEPADRPDNTGLALGTTSLHDPVAITHGWALVDLGQPAEAGDILGEALAGIPTTSVRARTRFGVRRMLAQAQTGHLDEVTTLVPQLLRDEHQVDSATIRIDLRRLSHALQRWEAGNPQIRELQLLLTVALAEEPR